MRRVTAAGKLRSRPHIRDHEQMVEDELKRQEEEAGHGWLRHKGSVTRGISANGKPCFHIVWPQKLELPTRPPAAVLARPRSSIGSRSSAGATRRTHASSRDGPSDDDPHEPEPPSWWRNSADDRQVGFLDEEEAWR